MAQKFSFGFLLGTVLDALVDEACPAPKKAWRVRGEVPGRAVIFEELFKDKTAAERFAEKYFVKKNKVVNETKTVSYDFFGTRKEEIKRTVVEDGKYEAVLVDVPANRKVWGSLKECEDWARRYNYI